MNTPWIAPSILSADFARLGEEVANVLKAGASYITFHPEASEHVDRTLGLIKESGCKAGLVFNPASPIDVLEYTLDKVDMILLMSVNPGFGGQKFIPYVLDKARHVSQIIKASGRDIRLEIDGGVGPANIREVAEAGVDTFVAGSAVFGAGKDSDPNRYDSIIKALREELGKAELPKAQSGGCCGGGHH
jgi:ribulose-phosphate 3-epimerase